MSEADALPAAGDRLATQTLRLAQIMRRLRDPEHGCPWDRAQDFASIAPYTIEEAHEVAEAIARGDMAELRDELGDLLLQVVFHAQMAAEAGAFDLADVAATICAKMERRHPHVFGAARADTPGEVSAQWEAIKAVETPRASVLDGIALGLPALMRADKLQRRAARTGFDWPDASGPRAKVAEELAELDAATSDEARTEELGDLLFAVVNLARHLRIDAEAALRAANRKFEARFRAIEAHPGFAELSPEAQDALWRSVK